LSRAITVNITPSVGSVSSSGSYTVSPGATTTYTLTATNVDGTVSASTTVTVANLILSAPSSSSQVTVTADQPGTDVLTGGLGGFSNPGMLITLFGLLAIAALAAIILAVKRPAVAHADVSAGRRSDYPETATRAASHTPYTTPVDTGPRFEMSNGDSIPLSGSGGTLGRSDFRSMVRADRADLISRRHMRFECEDGECYIEDLSSINGTKINGSPIGGQGRYLLRVGDKVEIANVVSMTLKG